MIRVIVGFPRPDELDTPDWHPAQLRVWFREQDRKESTICTRNPTILNEMQGRYDRVWLRGKDGDTPLLSTCDVAWLSHFLLGDLYMNSEFDAWLETSVPQPQ